MAEFEIFEPRNPAELAQPYAEMLVHIPEFGAYDTSDIELQTMGNLNDMANEYDMFGRYLVKAGRAFAIEHEPELDENGQVGYGNFHGISFEGHFSGYSTVKILRAIGARSIRSFCLAFEQVKLLPDFQELGDSKLLCTPVFAADDMQRTG